MEITIPTWLLWTVGIIIWVFCSVLTYGLQLAVEERRYPHMAEDAPVFSIFWSAFVGMFGPISLALAWFIDRPKEGIAFIPTAWKKKLFKEKPLTMNDFLRKK